MTIKNRTFAARHNAILLALSLSMLASCAQSKHPTTEATLGSGASSDQMLASAPEPGIIRLTTIVSADWEVPRSGLINLDDPRAEGLEDGPEPIQIYAYVLEHPTRGRYLVDSGVASGFRDPSSAPVSGLIKRQMNTDALDIKQDTAQILAEKGPLEGVLLTHMHIDHVMGLPDIPEDVPVYVGSGETHAKAAVHMFTRGTVDNMVGRDRPVYEWPFEEDVSGRFEGVLDVFGDGMLYALHVPGHTPGTTAFLVRTTEGPVLLTGDVSHTDWGWRHCVEPGSYNLDGEGAAESLKTLRSLQAALPSLVVHLGHQAHKEDKEHQGCER